MATSKNRWELEEKRKKQQLLQNALDKANVGATAEKLSNAAQTIKKNTTTKSSSTASTPTVTAPKTNTSAITPATSTAAKTSVFQELPKLAGTVQKTAQTVLLGTQKNNDLRQLQKNSIAWHGTTDAATRSSLQRQNDAIRAKLGLSFDPTTGATFDAKTGINYSTPTQLLFGSSAGQRANTAAQAATSSSVRGVDTNAQQGANAHRTMADLYNRAAETWTDEDTKNRDEARKALVDEMGNILHAYGMTYSARSTGPNAAYTVSDDEAIARLREAGADETTIAYVQENIDMRNRADRLGRGVEATTKRFIYGIPALIETSEQKQKNLEQSRENPEYAALEAQEQRLLQRMRSIKQGQNNVAATVEYMKVYNELQEVQKKKNEIAVNTPVDPNKWGQTKLREAAEAQADATAGLAPVPRFLADTGISIAGNVPTMALAAVPGVGVAAGAALTGLNAAGQRAAELNAQGVSPGEALGRGVAAGVIEAVTEKLPLDEMANLLQTGGKKAVWNILRQMGVKAGEESASYVMNYVADLAANDPDAKFSFAELAQAALGGAVSGGVFGTAGTTIGGRRTQAGPVVGVPEEFRTSAQADMDVRMAQEAIQTAQGEALLPKTEIIQQGSEPRGMNANPYIGMPENMLQNRLAQMQRQYWSADAQTQQAILEDMARLSEAIEDTQANSQALGRRMAELDAQKRLAETVLPGPIRDRAIQQAEEAMQRVQQEAAAKKEQIRFKNVEDTYIKDLEQSAISHWDFVRELERKNYQKTEMYKNALERAGETSKKLIEAKQLNNVDDVEQNPDLWEKFGINASSLEAFQYGLSPEAAALEARERARNEAVQAAREQSVGAAEYNFDPFSRMSNEYGAIKRGEAPREREVDVPVSTDGNDRVSLFARTAMEAKATPDEAIERFEQEVANGVFSHDVRKDKESVNKARQTITEKGFDGAMEQWEDVTSGRRSAGKDDIVLAEILYARAMKDGDIDTGMRLAAEIAAEGTRAGQSIQAMRLLKRTTPEGKLYYIKKTVDNVQKDLDQKYGKKAPKVKVDEQLAMELLNAKTDQEANAAMDAIYNDVAAAIPSTFGERLKAWRYFAMLGNPRTHIRNVVGNIVFQIPTRASNKLSAGMQKAFIKDKDRRTRSILRNGKIKEFAKQDYKVMQDVMDGNQYTSEMSEIQRRKKPFPKPLQAVMDVNSKALDVEDQIFKRMTYVNSMTEFLTARRVDIDHISQDMLEQARTHAIKDAKRATFQDASALADAIDKIEKKNKATEIIVGGLFPFKRTPINIAKRGFDLSPAGLLKSLTYDLVQVKKGNMSATDAIDHISTGLTGTSLAALGAFLAAQGLLSASSPENDKERNFDVAQGSQEYAMNIGPVSYTIDWAAPAALPMFVGAEFYNAIVARDGGEEQAFKQATDAISRLFEPMINMTMLSGISSTLQSVGYSQTNPIFAIAENIGENYAGQVVPTLLGQIARTIDGTRRTTFADGNSQIPDGIQTFLQRQANKIPGLSKRQPAYTDVWGREDHSDNVVMRAFENFLSPGYISERVTGDAEQALRDLYNATGEASILPSKPQKYYKKDGKNVYLNAEQYATLTKEKGQQALDAIGALVQSSAYQSMTNDERVNAIKDIYDYSSALAANKVYGKELEGTIKTVKESGIEPGLYYAYKELQDTLNDTYESYEARDEVFQTIRSDDSLTDQQKNQLYHTLLIKGTSESQWEKYTKISSTVTAEEYIDAMIQSQAIKAYGDELDEDRATTEATEFSRYLDMKQYDSEKRAALENTFKFYNMFPAEAQNYTFEMISTNGSEDEKTNAVAIQNSGVTAAQYLTIKTLAKQAEYESGVSGAKLAAQAAIVAQNTQNYDQYAAIMHALGYKNIDDAYTGAGTLPAVEDSGSQISRQVESSTGFINPTTATRSKIVSWYGNREAPDTTYGKGSSFHEGVDIGGPNGQNLDGEIANSIGDGTVVDVGFDQYGYGNYVVVDYGNGYQALYGHLRQPSVSTGQKVNAGEEIGIIGGTGNVEAPHLHLKMTKDGQNIDPLTVIPGYGTARPATTSSTTKSSGGSGSGGGGKSSGSRSAKSTTIKGFDSYEGLDGLWM